MSEYKSELTDAQMEMLQDHPLIVAHIKHREIITELYRALVLLGAESDLLGTVGSWRDSLPDHEVLAGLKAWNEGQLERIKERIGHYEVSARSLPH